MGAARARLDGAEVHRRRIVTEVEQALAIANKWLDFDMNPLVQMVHGDPDCDACVLARQFVRASDEVRRLEKLVYVPGRWRCAKCNFSLTQSNLYVESGAVGPRDEAGDKCPNCHGPLWRVSAMDERNEAFKTANDMFDEVERLRKLVPEAQRYPEQRPPDAA